MYTAIVRRVVRTDQNNDVFVLLNCVIKSNFGSAFVWNMGVAFIVVNNTELAIVSHLIVTLHIYGHT